MRVHLNNMKYFQYNIIQNLDIKNTDYRVRVAYDPIWLPEIVGNEPHARLDVDDLELEVTDKADISKLSDDMDTFSGKITVIIAHPFSTKEATATINLKWAVNKTLDWSEDTKAMASPVVEVLYETSDKAEVKLKILGPDTISITESNSNYTSYKYLLKKSNNLKSSEYAIVSDIGDPRITFDSTRMILRVPNDPTINTSVTLKVTNTYNDRVFTKTIKVGS